MNALSVVFLVMSAAIAQAPPAPARPNLVVILVDDLRWDVLGASGHPFVSSPNIDRLAREGVLFRNAFVTTPLCSPSRGSLLTGQYARTHGALINTSALRSWIPTFPELLLAAGYDTAFVGKWHMGDTDDAPKPGFARWSAFAGQGSYRDPELNIDGVRVRAQGYTTDVLNRYAMDFLRTAARSPRPFLLYLSHKAVHGPLDPPERHAELYAGRKVECSPGCADTLEGKLALTRDVPGAGQLKPGRKRFEEQVRARLRLLKSVDEGVGEILSLLAEAGILDQTAVVFTSDSGLFFREHGLADKRWPYEEAIRVPLLLRYPPLATPGARIERLVLNTDLAPTLLELGNVSVPPGIHGRSLVSLLRGETVGWRDMFAAEYFEEDDFPLVPTWEAVRSERWKYIRYPALGVEFDELYDLWSDPYELTNQAHNAILTDTLESLRRRLDRLLTFPPRPPSGNEAPASPDPLPSRVP